MNRRSFLKRVAAAPVVAAALPAASPVPPFFPPPSQVPDGTPVFNATGQAVGVVEGNRVISAGHVSVKFHGVMPGSYAPGKPFNITPLKTITWED